jgi:hypothetical protein
MPVPPANERGAGWITPPPPPTSGERNSAAVAAFVLGLLSLPLAPFGLAGLLAIIFGAVGRRNAFYSAPHRKLATWWIGLGP